ncbi:MAG: mechanosensitive ion channel family protein [Bacteroidia bacterium]|nr:mechanosensitive ion channel family protein [Bacteroidia bacterium]NNF29998.1 mechanosensitive ion channel [Flavobacteriaceae bacterium]MBT8276022.1 mechanosensitive ion channel family protein [Bacteroidia bacterium]NNJ83202.1 mechanosensitive ion channel [Flavobacteriaceae bacterium]NNK53703.1 mechanosensitive ion channel [Flavobacteriaceae bacterium]
MNREQLIEYAGWLRDLLIEQGMGPFWASIINTVALIIVTTFIAVLIDIIIRKIIVQLFKAFSNRSKTTFDDYLVKSNFPRYLAHAFPLALVWYLIPVIFADFRAVERHVETLAEAYLVILCILVFRSILRTITNYLRATNPKFADKPLESYVQVMMIFAWGAGIFFIVNAIFQYSIASIATLSAVSAVILLIFKDTILGFVASIQVSVNDTVRIGDWITFSKFGADGLVTEINLAAVRVQNWDNTYTTIPTYSLIADSFQNWRGMQESDGRRIKRSIHIKQSSVKFLSPEEIENFKAITLVKPFIEHRQRDIDKYNARVEADKSILINGRNQTNLGIFRKYIDAYLHESPAINKDMYMMVRHLNPTDKGIPVEIMCWSYDKVWQNYEAIQADLFDHFISAAKYFDLEIFELPTGKDIAALN